MFMTACRYTSSSARSGTYEVFKRNGYLDDLRATQETTVASAQALGDPELQGGTRNDLGLTNLVIGDYFQAGRQLTLAEPIAQLTNSEIGIPTSLFNLARRRLIQHRVHFIGGHVHDAEMPQHLRQPQVRADARPA